MRVWLDLANSPHPLLFAPVARRLEAIGHELVVTVRDNAQTVELARTRWPEAEVIAGASPAGRLNKLRAILQRARALRRWGAKQHPDVAISHNSYAQIIAARALRIPVMTAMDFEYQPANHLAFRLATTVVVPEAIDPRVLIRQGAPQRKLVRLPGLKEQLYLGDFDLDPVVLSSVGLSRRPRLLAVVRTAPTGALYHRSHNVLFEDALRVLCGQEGCECVVLARTPEQIAALEASGLENCIIPRDAIDARSLMYECDVMIGAGGTMTREAALMGIPTWTLFAGRTPAVDLRLERQGLIRRLTSPHQLARVGPRQGSPTPLAQLRASAEVGLGVMIRSVLTTAQVNAGSPEP